MKTPAPADLHRWSEELARNPASLAFLPLARAYRRLGRRDLALQLCLRGLEHHPTHVEAHALLALLYFEAGERAKAADEWATVLRLKPGNFEALRGMGFRHLEQGDIGRARQHLERAALIRPDDATVQEALRLIRHREASLQSRAAAPPPRARPAPAPSPAPASPPRPVMPAASPGAERRAPAKPESTTPAARRSPPMEAVAAASPVGPRTPKRTIPLTDQMPADPARVFESMAAPQLLGVLLLDLRGLVLAGSLRGAQSEKTEELGGILGAAIDEAVRTVTHLSLGAWRGLMIECAAATIHVAPVGDEALVVIAAKRETPAGWILRTAAHAAALAERFVGVYT